MPQKTKDAAVRIQCSWGLWFLIKGQQTTLCLRITCISIRSKPIMLVNQHTTHLIHLWHTSSLTYGFIGTFLYFILVTPYKTFGLISTKKTWR